jgi:hypothetical protein
MRHFFCLMGLFLSIVTLFAQGSAQYMPKDREIFGQFLSYIMPHRYLGADSIRERTAVFFLGKPYVSNTLEISDEECLVVNLREFDCTTFVETVLALSRTVLSDSPSFETFLSELRNIRYRNGVVTGYASRIHYTSDWVFEQETHGRLKNVSAFLRGVMERKEINFMSTNRQLYRKLMSDDEALKEIITMEKEVNSRGGFSYIPKEKIGNVASEIPHMAMIGFVTSIKGLDCSHVGFAFKKGDKLSFIHASTNQMKVLVDEKTIDEYCQGQKSCVGVLVSKIL